ncbi:MAG: thiamine-phosphate kinase [Caulobacterales bacterium]
MIASLFAPLAHHPAARGLQDDAALWVPHGAQVMTCDAIVEGVHFLPDDPLDTVAQKALRVNLSDLAAKGAKPDGALLSLIWPKRLSANDMATFAAGLGVDLETYGIALLGGDMTTTPGPLTISIMAFGTPANAREPAHVPARADAKPGQQVYVSGTIGDSVLGLMARQGALPVDLPQDLVAYLVDRYRRPQPRLVLAPWLAAHAGASMDVSDGLIADARKLAAASGVRLALAPHRVPLSPAANAALSAAATDLPTLLAGGDDYEILFTIDPGSEPSLCAYANRVNLAVTHIGTVERGEGLSAELANGRDLGREPGGYVHRFCG